MQKQRSWLDILCTVLFYIGAAGIYAWTAYRLYMTALFMIVATVTALFVILDWGFGIRLPL